MAYVDFIKVSAPTTPSSNHVAVFADTNTKLLMQKNDAGVITSCAPLFVLATSAITTTAATAQAITNFSFPVNNTENWVFIATLIMTGITNGTKFAVTGPTGTVVASALGNTSSTTAYLTAPITAFDTLTGTAHVTSNGTAGLEVKIVGSLQATSTATFQLQFASVTNGNTSTISAGSALQAWRVA